MVKASVHCAGDTFPHCFGREHATSCCMSLHVIDMSEISELHNYNYIISLYCDAWGHNNTHFIHGDKRYIFFSIAAFVHFFL